MKTGRPKIEVPLETIDIIIDVVSATILLGMFIYTAMSYSDLPDIIPSHFNAEGAVDGHSEKYVLWFLPILGLLLFAGMFILNKYPHIHNYMVNITKDNALKNYRFSTRIVRFTNLFVMFIFAVIIYKMVQSAHNKTVALESWFLPFIIISSVIIPVLIFIYQKKINKS